MLLDDGSVKLADLGLAIDSSKERPVTRLGTLEYMSPEVLRCQRKTRPADHKDRTDFEYGPSADVWAVGVLAFECLHLRSPFAGVRSIDDLDRKIRDQVRVAEDVSAAAADFIRLTLHHEPTRRPSAAALLQHPWVLQHIRPERAISCPGEGPGSLPTSPSARAPPAHAQQTAARPEVVLPSSTWYRPTASPVAAAMARAYSPAPSLSTGTTPRSAPVPGAPGSRQGSNGAQDPAELPGRRLKTAASAGASLVVSMDQRPYWKPLGRRPVSGWATPDGPGATASAGAPLPPMSPYYSSRPAYASANGSAALPERPAAPATAGGGGRESLLESLLGQLKAGPLVHSVLGKIASRGGQRY